MLPFVFRYLFGDQSYAAASVKCAPGDVLALITDGLVEVFDPDDRELGLAPQPAGPSRVRQGSRFPMCCSRCGMLRANTARNSMTKAGSSCASCTTEMAYTRPFLAGTTAIPRT
jgi:Stage II sporulation protein E (SpoIIE)